MNSTERYSCQIALPGFSREVQQKLTDASVLIIGMGGLGCPAAQYLVAAGVGKVGIVDDDVVSVSNLHRQILYRESDANKPKVDVAHEVLTAQNPHIKIIKHQTRVNNDNIMSLVNDYDVVLDCTDNFETRYLVNDACVLAGKTLVYGAIYQYEGQVAVWNAMLQDGKRSPNYRDLYPEVNPASVPDCATGGVIPTIAGMIGCIQANEAIKCITGTGELLAGKLITLDVQTMQSRVIKMSTVSKVSIVSLPGTVDVPEITIEELRQNREQYALIDVRNADERAVYNIGGMHISLSEIGTAEIDVTKPVVCYCASGKRSRVAAMEIKKRFLSAEVYSLKGGIAGVNTIQ